METLSKIKDGTNKEIKLLEQQAKEMTTRLLTLDRSSKEFAEIFEKRADLLDTARGKFMSLRFAGI